MFSAEDQSTAVLRLDEITHGDPDAAISRQGTLVPKKAEGGISNDRQLFKSWLFGPTRDRGRSADAVGPATQHSPSPFLRRALLPKAFCASQSLGL